MGTGDPKEEDLSLDVMPSSHTPFGSWRKTSSKEKDLGVQIAPRLTRKMPVFSGFLQRGGIFLLLLFFLWQSHNHGNRDAFGVW